MGGSPDRPARFFDSPEEFGAWLALNHDTETAAVRTGSLTSWLLGRGVAFAGPGFTLVALVTDVDLR